MKLFQRIFFAAVLAGLAAGLGYAALQQWKVAPLIAQAEVFDAAAPAAHDHDHEATDAAAPAVAAHSHDTDAWAPARRSSAPWSRLRTRGRARVG